MKSIIAAAAIFFALLVLVAPARSVNAGATSISAGQTCAGSGVSVVFGWTGNDLTALMQSLDVGSSQGFEPGSFSSVAPLPPTANSYQWDGLAPATNYYVRVVQQLNSGALDSSGIYQVQTMPCGAAVGPAAPAPSQMDIDNAACAMGDFGSCARVIAGGLLGGDPSQLAAICASAGPLGAFLGCP